jgi:ATP-dependent Clp protease ATP-binding subunit ClpB
MEEYDIHFGARSLQHAVDKLIINPIAAAHEKVSKRSNMLLNKTQAHIE